MKAGLYARFSTDKQSEASIDDQMRVCERLAAQHRFQVVAKFSDAAISGGTARRPGYQAMLAAARARKFDVLIAEDTSRLWRNLAEQSPRLAELSDLGVAVVTHDLDTRQESAAILGPVTGAMAEQYRKEIGRRTRRGLEGLARNARPTGGRAFGYSSAKDSANGQVEIDEAEAAVVRRIFSDYAAGRSPAAIARSLKQDGVPCPGASWKRASRAKGWRVSAIAGNPARGLGILNNELYIGRVIWNRFRWIRSASDSSKRRAIVNRREDWIIRDEPRLRIVTDELWRKVKARQRERQHEVGERISRGIGATRAGRTGRNPGYLLSGILKCAHCGSRLVIAGKDRYACSSRVHGDGCANDAHVNRRAAEGGLLAGIRDQLRRPEVVEQARRRIVSALRQARKAKTEPKVDRIAELEAEVAALVEAIAGGVLRGSPAVAQRLAKAEAELAALRSVQAEARAPVEALMPAIVDRYLAAVDRLPETLARGDVDRSREALRGLIGTIEVEVDAREIRFRAASGAVEAALQRLAGTSQISLVAGAGFEPATFGL